MNATNNNNGDNEMISETRTFGIEIEFIGASQTDVVNNMRELGVACSYERYNHNTRDHWKIVTDSSVCGGFELVSPVLKGADGIDQLEKACAALQSAGARVNRSCGVHVHHGISDYRAKNMQYLVELYKKSEARIDEMMPVSRRASNNMYCKSTTAGFYDASHTDRYYKLNFTCFHRYGTVEFRQHAGSIEAAKLVNWVLLTQAMVVRCKRKVTPFTGHSLTWFDIRQALGMVHNASASAQQVAEFFTARRESFGFGGRTRSAA